MMRRSTRQLVDFATRKKGMVTQIAALPEVVQQRQLIDTIKTDLDKHVDAKNTDFAGLMAKDSTEFSIKRARIVAEAAILTHALHVESRIASMLGEGFYTIGPCGEEAMGAIGLLMRTDDPMALHYRHAAANIARQLKGGEDLKSVATNRARGFCVSASDPVTGGAHCALGGGPHDFVVTSTLASQACPAVGRAMGGVLANYLDVPTTFKKDLVSFVSLGDGSIHNGHFLSANNLAEFATFRQTKVPLLTCITDNGLSISFRTQNYVVKQFSKKLQMPVFVGRGDDFADLWVNSKKAIDTVRKTGRPATLIVPGVTRRFGHAATDRQIAYMGQSEIAMRHSTCAVLPMCAQLVRAGVYTTSELSDKVEEIVAACNEGFEVAHAETKLTSREALIARNSAPFVPMPPAARDAADEHKAVAASAGITGGKAQVMRKHMNKVFDELLTENKAMVYMGEDVRHGGYYLVTEDLAKKHSPRLFDFAPDETSLVGAGMGFAQSGLIPLVELPYAKYLDCAMDMFTEACIMNWLSNGKQPNGMIFRLQGFGRGVFGGNYHTHNMLHMPPGLDVVCYSNGPDYARGMRFAVQQAKKGRVVMFVDCTELLNLREISPGTAWEFAYTGPGEFADFDTVMHHVHPKSTGDKKMLIVTYGNGVVAAMQARALLEEAHGILVDIVDSPLLSAPPEGLKKIVGDYETVLFADVCKKGQNPLSGHLAQLQESECFRDSRRVRCIAAQCTYNPLGTTLTFLSRDDIVGQVLRMLKS